MEATQTLPVTAPVAPGPCNKTSSTTSSRPYRARNPSETTPVREQVSACGDDAPGRCKSPPRNSPHRSLTGQPPPAARTKAPPSAGRAMLRPIDSALGFSYSRGPDTTLMIPHLDASASSPVAKYYEGTRIQPCAFPLTPANDAAPANLTCQRLHRKLILWLTRICSLISVLTKRKRS